MSKFDFSGWATRTNLRCSDGRTILKDAFKHCDGQTVPLVWNHQHNESFNVLGHALLENRDEGVYAYCTFNDTESGKNAKLLVEHGDISALSIYANKLEQRKNAQGGRDVIHGSIREVSLVLAGANPGAFIDDIPSISHGEDGVENDEAVIYTGEDIELHHAEEAAEAESHDGDDSNKNEAKEESKMAENKENNEKTVKEVFDTLTEEQKTVVYALIGQALEDAANGSEEDDDDATHSDYEEGDDTMKHNVFDQDDQQRDGVLSHSEIEAIFSDAARYGTLKSSFFAHAGDTEHATVTQDYGINGTDFLFPEAKALNMPPEFIGRDTGWVSKVMKGVHHTPFSRIKSVFADITEADARAKGYIKGKLKKEEVFSLLRRTTTPTTIYKKQKFDRDDLIDVTDFDVIAWIKAEMRVMLDEEIARAILIGDGRDSLNEDKINESNIRPIWKEEELYTLRHVLETAEGETADDRAKKFIKLAIKKRKDYKGSGKPTLYTTEDMLTDMLLIEDSTGRVIYDSEEKLKTALRVAEIVTVPVMEGATRTDAGTSKKYAPLGIFVNLADYNVGADKGGAVNMFDDFDIDYNQQKYLIETRCSGAMIKPYGAYVIEEEVVAG